MLMYKSPVRTAYCCQGRETLDVYYEKEKLCKSESLIQIFEKFR